MAKGGQGDLGNTPPPQIAKSPTAQLLTEGEAGADPLQHRHGLCGDLERGEVKGHGRGGLGLGGSVGAGRGTGSWRKRSGELGAAGFNGAGPTLGPPQHLPSPGWGSKGWIMVGLLQVGV